MGDTTMGGAVRMTPDDREVLTRADELGDALARAMHEVDSGTFYRLLVECNATIRETTGVEYGTICTPPDDDCC